MGDERDKCTGEIEKGCGISDTCDRRKETCLPSFDKDKGYECCTSMCRTKVCGDHGKCQDIEKKEPGSSNCQYECECEKGYEGKKCQWKTIDREDVHKITKEVME